MIWIRNQKRTMLVNVNKVYVLNNAIYGDYELVGVYSSKEKALEVLDDIQYKINTLEMLRNDYETGLKVLTQKYGLGHIREVANPVYEMPQGEEV